MLKEDYYNFYKLFKDKNVTFHNFSIVQLYTLRIKLCYKKIKNNNYIYNYFNS